MRWLSKYPITSDEVLETINLIPIRDQVCGDITPMIKRELLKYFNESENMNKILEQLKVHS